MSTDKKLKNIKQRMQDFVHSEDFAVNYGPQDQEYIRSEFKKILQGIQDYETEKARVGTEQKEWAKSQALQEARRETREERNPILNTLGDVGMGLTEFFAMTPATLSALGLQVAGKEDAARYIMQGVEDWRGALETTYPSAEWNADNPDSWIPTWDWVGSAAARNLIPMVGTGKLSHAMLDRWAKLRGAAALTGRARNVTSIGGTMLGMSAPETYRGAITYDEQGNVILPKSPMATVAASVLHAKIEQMGISPTKLASLSSRTFIDTLKRVNRRHGLFNRRETPN